MRLLKKNSSKVSNLVVKFDAASFFCYLAIRKFISSVLPKFYLRIQFN